MEAILVVLAMVALALAALEWGADSRPIIGDTHTNHLPRWFPL